MKKIMLNQKSGMTYDDIKTYVTKLKIYQNKFTIFPTELYAKEFIENGYITGLQNIVIIRTSTAEARKLNIAKIGKSSIVNIGLNAEAGNDKINTKLMMNLLKSL